MTAADPRRDALLAIRCQLGDAAALDELIDRFHPPLHRYARRVTGSDADADDVAQEAWVRILRGLPRLRTPEALRSWLFGIVHRVLMGRFRSDYARSAALNEIHEIGAADTMRERADAAELHARLDDLERALDRLPVVERDVLALFYLHDLSLAEIADALGVPVGTVKSRLFRARHLLKERMSDGPDC
jgi:RNA polymerase sigma-70 factor (ECF subfamily)